MLLKDLCTLDVVYCEPTTSALSAARLMRARHVGDLVVVDEAHGDREPIGVVTDRDIVIEVLGKDLDPAKVSVRQIMRTPVIVAQWSEDVATAIERMRTHGVRRIPVMGEGGKLAGILCFDDLILQLASDANALAEVVRREHSHEQRTRR